MTAIYSAYSAPGPAASAPAIRRADTTAANTITTNAITTSGAGSSRNSGDSHESKNNRDSRDTAELSDAELLRRHCDGCPQAYRTLITRHERLLAWTLHHLRIVPGERADILQEALLKVHRQAASFRGTGCAGSWLRTIVTNTALTHLRDSGRRHEDLDPSSDGILDRLQRVPDPRAADASHTVERILLTQAVKGLDPTLRDAILLADLHGLSMREVSAQTGVPVGTVKSRLSRARHQLRRHLVDAGIAPAVRH